MVESASTEGPGSAWRTSLARRDEGIWVFRSTTPAIAPARCAMAFTTIDLVGLLAIGLVARATAAP
jgi:hypothetical protein